MGPALQRAPVEYLVHYERRRPEETTLYQLVQEHIESFLAQVETEGGVALPEFVKAEFDAFLACGILAHGFLRNRAGQVVLQLKSAFKDGTTHIVMAPLEFMQRLAALVPRPRLHLIRFHGVLAPNEAAEIVPSSPEQTSLRYRRRPLPNAAAAPSAAVEDRGMQNPRPSGPAHPRPATLACAAIRFIPDNLRSRKPVANASRRRRSL